MRTFVFYLLLLNSFNSLNAQSGWQSLILNDLSNWKQIGGDAQYRLEDQVIIGEAVMNSPNSFLTTQKIYSDFILEFDFYLDSDMNSGTQIRSNSLPNYKDGRVHGYQVEIDPSPRAFSGGIYDEARRMWLYPISRNPQAHRAFVRAAWNKIHIEAIGNEINTWINGVHCASLVDDLTADGFIGLQVHDIGNNKALEGATARWRDIKIITSNYEEFLFDRDPSVDQNSYLDNHLTVWEKRKGWRLLWDGKTMEGWRTTATTNLPMKSWQIDNGVLSGLDLQEKPSTGTLDLISLEKFSNFELIVDFKIERTTDSGIMYLVSADHHGKDQPLETGLEFQISDDKSLLNKNKGVKGNRTLASLFDLIPAENLSVQGRSKQFKGIGQWNRARIISNEGRVEHWLNGEKVIEYDRQSQAFQALVSRSMYKDLDHFGQNSEGYILLQYDGENINFKNIKIREF